MKAHAQTQPDLLSIYAGLPLPSSKLSSSCSKLRWDPDVSLAQLRDHEQPRQAKVVQRSASAAAVQVRSDSQGLNHHKQKPQWDSDVNVMLVRDHKQRGQKVKERQSRPSIDPWVHGGRLMMLSSSAQHESAGLRQHADRYSHRDGMKRPSARASAANISEVADVLRSMTSESMIGEADDSRLLPALETWLSGKLPFQHFHRAVDASDAHGVTMLMVAACFGKVACVRRLLSAGADVNRRSSAGRTALVYTCLGPNLPEHKAAIISMLLQAGASAASKATALEAAGMLGRSREIGLLAAAGALRRGQVATIDCPARPKLHLALCSVLHYDDVHQMYAVLCLTKGRGTVATAKRAVSTPAPGIPDPAPPGSWARLTPGSPQRRASELANSGPSWHDRTVSLPPSQLLVALHHLVDENAAPILASPGQSPLDIAAATLAGAPVQLPDVSPQLPSEGEYAEAVLQDASLQNASQAATLTTAIDELHAAPHAPASGESDATDEAEAAAAGSVPMLTTTSRWPRGTLVRIVRRPEQWLRGRIGYVSAWEPEAQRYMVSLTSSTGPPHDEWAPEGATDARMLESDGAVLPIHVAARHLEPVEASHADLHQQPQHHQPGMLMSAAHSCGVAPPVMSHATVQPCGPPLPRKPKFKAALTLSAMSSAGPRWQS